MICVLAFLLLVGLDQALKLYSAKNWRTDEGVILLPGIIKLKYLYPENRGMAFGMLQNQMFFLAALSLIILLYLLWIYFRTPDHPRYRPLRVALVFLASGAFGNFIDRCFRHYVIDFIQFIFFDFPVFNLADSYVVIGSIWFLILVLFKYRNPDELEFLLPGRLGR